MSSFNQNIYDIADGDIKINHFTNFCVNLSLLKKRNLFLGKMFNHYCFFFVYIIDKIIYLKLDSHV